MKTSEIRKAFLDYFAGHGHTVVDSSPLVPAHDPSLLFTNAGMVQFKDVFLGLEDPGFRRAATAQRCVRAGGKHNDLDNVGYTARHHTFFEMLGNFSFGEYFKREAIQYAWELLTERFGLPADRLWVTVYEQDDEAAAIWLNEVGVNADRFSRCGDKDNFWMMGDTGPCGPCSEIFYDHGPGIAGGPPGSPQADGDRYTEIWNLVFMQYERDREGSLKPIPRPSVDTGMGLERIAAVLQGVHDNYDTDLFVRLIEAVTEVVDGRVNEPASLRVIADHIRSCAFLVLDGVLPSNEGRGYVLRRIIRRALRHGHKLGIEGPFFHRLVKPLAAEMQDAYPLLMERCVTVADALRQEEERFAETLGQGMRILESSINDLSGDTIPGEVVFQLYDTYGFPYDLTADIARERALKLDSEGFDAAMEAQRARARAASHFANVDTGSAIAAQDLAALGHDQDFTGYESHAENTQVLGLFVDGQPVDAVVSGTIAAIVLARTPFYAESGGQVGDRGELRAAAALFAVTDTRKQGGLFLHVGQLESGSLRVGDTVTATIDDPRRQAIRLNHSATHLMHAALREVLGSHVEQKGSLVDAERLRFDFSHPQPMTQAELDEVERLVNREVRRNVAVEAVVMPYREAIAAGAMALFGEKYGEEVRVLSMGGFSTELCGGTHVERTGDIGLFKLMSESGVASGVRRIEALTGSAAQEAVSAMTHQLQDLAQTLKTNPAGLHERLTQTLVQLRGLEKENQELKARLTGQSGRDVGDRAVAIGDIQLVVERLEDADVDALRATCDQLRDRFPRGVALLAAVEGDKIRLIAGVSKALTDTIHAGKLVNFVANQIGGKGGGRPDMAQAGGTDVAGLDDALASVAGWIEAQTA